MLDCDDDDTNPPLLCIVYCWMDKKIAENASVCLCSCSDSKQQIELALTIRMYAPWWAKELESKSHLGEFRGWTENSEIQLVLLLTTRDFFGLATCPKNSQSVAFL